MQKEEREYSLECTFNTTVQFFIPTLIVSLFLWFPVSNEILELLKCVILHSFSQIPKTTAYYFMKIIPRKLFAVRNSSFLEFCEIFEGKLYSLKIVRIMLCLFFSFHIQYSKMLCKIYFYSYHFQKIFKMHFSKIILATKCFWIHKKLFKTHNVFFFRWYWIRTMNKINAIKEKIDGWETQEYEAILFMRNKIQVNKEIFKRIRHFQPQLWRKSFYTQTIYLLYE